MTEHNILFYTSSFLDRTLNIVWHVLYLPSKHENSDWTPSARLLSGVPITKGGAHALMEQLLSRSLSKTL